MSVFAYDDDFPLDELMRLLRACTAGDEAARLEFLRRYEPLIRRWLRIRGFTIRAGDFDELIAEFRAKLWLTRFAFLLRYEPRPGTRFETYLRVVVRRFERDWLEKEANYRKLFDGRVVDWAVDPDATPEQRRQADVFLTAFRRRLTPLEQQVFDLTVQGYRPAEIAIELGKDRGHIDKILHSLRKKLRGFLGLGE